MKSIFFWIFNAKKMISMHFNSFQFIGKMKLIVIKPRQQFRIEMKTLYIGSFTLNIRYGEWTACHTQTVKFISSSGLMVIAFKTINPFSMVELSEIGR